MSPKTVSETPADPNKTLRRLSFIYIVVTLGLSAIFFGKDAPYYFMAGMIPIFIVIFVFRKKRVEPTRK